MVDSSEKSRAPEFKYDVKFVPGFFLQDNRVKPELVQALPPRFGLLDDTQVRWELFFVKLAELNNTSPAHVKYKAVFLARHGQGDHNVAEIKYGTDAWNTHWSTVATDGETTWGPDPELTALGISQAQAANVLWRSELPLGLPAPKKMYCSPLTRAIHTNVLTFEGVREEGAKAVVVENVREHNGRNPCDNRRSKSYLNSRFAEYITFEDGFSEEDKAFDPVHRETEDELETRAKLVLDKIFDEEWEDENGGEESIISITSHSGFIRCFCKAVKHTPYALPTGGVIPMVLRAVQL